uniref:Uncharacterized protein n=1 Tax=Arundo donax TaxID=35708 RepID=A0A0A9QNY4_ARUDO
MMKSCWYVYGKKKFSQIDWKYYPNVKVTTLSYQYFLTPLFLENRNTSVLYLI